MTTRRSVLSLLGLAPVGLAALDLVALDLVALAPRAALAAGDNDGFALGTFVAGQADAPVTVTEFASMTCPHCARFNASTYLELKKLYIDTGKLRWIFRDFPLDGLALKASQLVRCAGPEHAEALTDLLFRSQGDWARSQDPLAALKQSVRLAGLPGDKADACMNDENLSKAIAQSRLDAEQRLKIDSTPSFAIGSKVVAGELSVAEFTTFLKDNGLKD